MVTVKVTLILLLLQSMAIITSVELIMMAWTLPIILTCISIISQMILQNFLCMECVSHRAQLVQMMIHGHAIQQVSLKLSLMDAMYLTLPQMTLVTILAIVFQVVQMELLYSQRLKMSFQTLDSLSLLIFKHLKTQYTLELPHQFLLPWLTCG